MSVDDYEIKAGNNLDKQGDIQSLPTLSRLEAYRFYMKIPAAHR